ncbi:MAG: recombinase family protein [Flavobacteriales bacterium]|nr:recombinase family protein [Flavobacteriales bacterium]
MDKLSLFKSFAPKEVNTVGTGVNAVIYTRVSHHSQEENTSLESQRKYCENFAARRGLNIVGYFGGTYESAKTDDRKEFNRMLSFVKRSKNITYVVVYSYERFSRSGINGAQIADDLLKKYGVITLAVTQELDPTTPAGSFQQKILFLFGQMDNELRRDKTVTGMKELLRKGFCPYSIPRGYINLNKGKAVNQNIVLSDEGKLLQKAFHWKADLQMRNSEIIKRLSDMGMDIDERRLGEIFSNPFYCGIIVSKMIPGEVIEGRHEPMVSQDTFLKVNNVISEARNHPVTHKEEDENLPLKRFMKCGSCDTPMTGYLVKRKGLYYYKCRTKGCKNNKSAKHLHNQFEGLLESFKVAKDEIKLVKKGIQLMYKAIFEEQFENQSLQKAKIAELQKKLDTIEEKFVVGDINKDLYTKYSQKYGEEMREIEAELAKLSFGSSNLEKCLDLVMKFCEKPLKWWRSAHIGERTLMQNIIFPDGIIYNRENEGVRTSRINAVFAPIPELVKVLKGIKKGETINFDDFSSRVTPAGFKPATLRAEI